MSLAYDRETRQEARKKQRQFKVARNAEFRYQRQLRGVARQVGLLADIYDPDAPERSSQSVIAALKRYADMIRPWAAVVAERMLQDVARRDEQAWARLSVTMGRALRQEIKNAPTGDLMKALLAEQVTYITSMPTEAAQRVHEWTLRGIEGAVRADQVAKEIYATGHVTKSRADLIARTEVARTSSTLVQARATFVGSEGYLWRSSVDSDVRKEHRKLNGKYFRWDDPPIAGTNGMRYHAGQGPNCRCVCEPVVPEEL